VLRQRVVLRRRGQRLQQRGSDRCPAAVQDQVRLRDARGGHPDPGRPRPTAYPDPNSYTDSYTDPNTDPNTHANTHANTDANTHANEDTDPDTDGHAYTDTHAHTYALSHGAR
jgi:hypothetical protein